MKTLQYAVVAVVCAVALVGCRSMTGRSVGQQIDDKVITTQVKTKMMTEEFKSVFSTGVGTHFGVVRLSGNVPTEAQKMEAERIARRVAGVKGVNNEILVVPRDGKSAPAASGATPAAAAASPAASPGGQPLTLEGQVTAIDRDRGDVTVHTASGDVLLRLPSATIRDLEQGQRLSINAGQ
jgi:hypothetical protein